MTHDRRQATRMPVGFYASQFVDDEPRRGFTTSLSARGVFLEQVLGPMERRSDTVQLELPLPGATETLWTRAEVVYDRFGLLFHGTALRFTSMADSHRRLLRAWLDEAAAGGFGPVGEVVQGGPGIAIVRPPPRMAA